MRAFAKHKSDRLEVTENEKAANAHVRGLAISTELIVMKQ